MIHNVISHDLHKYYSRSRASAATRPQSLQLNFTSVMDSSSSSNVHKN